MSSKWLCVYPAVVIVLMFIGAKFAKRKEFHDDFLSLESSKILQGLAALGIVLHHLTQQVTKNGSYPKGPITEMNNMGLLFTAVFFFFSGYGLLKSYLTKPDYMKSFLLKRLPTVLIPFFLSNIIYYLYVGAYRGMYTKPKDIIISLTGFSLINGNTWFLVEIVFLYLFFFLAYRFIKKEKAAFGAVSVAVIALITVSLLLGHDQSMRGGHWFMGEWWYNSTITFLFGMLVAREEKHMVSFAKRNYAWLLPVAIICFYGLYKLAVFSGTVAGYYREWEGYPGYGEKALTLVIQSMTCVAFVTSVLLLRMKIRIYNPVIAFIGKISLSIYIIHELMKQLVYVIHRPSNMLFFLLVFVYSIVGALIFHVINGLLLKGWGKLFLKTGNK